MFRYVTAITLFLISLSSADAGIEPSQAFAPALEFAEKSARQRGGLGDDQRVSEVELGIGQYEEGGYGVYSVRLRFVPTGGGETTTCRVLAWVERVPFAKQPPRVAVLEEVVNDYQIIALARMVVCAIERR